MNAVKYLKEKSRMTKVDSTGLCRYDCKKCLLSEKNNGKDVLCTVFQKLYPELAVTIVEEWSAKHPIKTRQSELLKMFPSAKVDAKDVVSLCPGMVDATIKKSDRCSKMSCCECRYEYWGEKVE